MLLSFSLSLSLSTELQEFWKQDYFYTLSWKLISKPKRFICLKICLLPLKKPQPNTLSRDSSPFRSLCPSRSLALSLLEIATLLLFFFFFSTPFQFLFSQFPTCGEGEEEGPRRSIWFIGGRRSLPRAEDCNFEAGGRAFRTAFRRRLSPCLLLLLLNVPPLLSRLSRLSRLTRLRESHSLIDNRRLATSVSGECFCQTASRRMSIASSIPSLTRRGRIHDRKLWVGIYPNDFAVHCSLVRCS